VIKPGLYIARVLRVDLKAGVHTCIWTENSISFQRGKDRFTMTVDRLSPKSRPVEASLIVQNNRGLVLFNVLEG
jgi:hypothetical protein